MVNKQRRLFLLGSLAISAGLICNPSEIWARAGQLSESSEFLNRVADLVIPATATPGATQVGVPRFVLSAIQNGLQGATNLLLDNVQQVINNYVGGDFLVLPQPKQHQLLAEIDAKVFANDPALPAALADWRKLKALIVIGYYSSEVGSTQELRYQLIPGRFEPDVKLGEDRRGWSSDWTGVKYA
jgi:hypothetical protein